MNTEPNVYVVDNHEGVRKSLGQLIEAVGYSVENVSSAEAFLDSYDSTRPGCLVLDIRMPGICGLALQKKLTEYKDLLPIIFITGHCDVSTITEAFKGGAVDVIEKPFNDQKLLDSINKAIQTSLKHYANIIALGGYSGQNRRLPPPSNTA